MNIIWQKPDGGVAVTMLSQEAVERMAWANENKAFLDGRDALLATRARLTEELSVLSVALNSERDKMEAARGVDEAVFLGALGKVNTASEWIAHKQDALRETEAELRIAAEVEHVRDNIGLSEHDHELILLARGDIAEDHTCVGHSIDVPADRTFRNAWCWTGKVDHDMEKCRAIHRDRMRAARAPKLAALDVAQLRGQDVEAEKTALRDVTDDPAIAAAKTPQELKAVWPEILR